MKILYADLEREWRGGQSQAFLTMRGLRDRGHQVELVAAKDSPLAQRTMDLGITVHPVPRLGLRAWAASKLKALTLKGGYDVLQLNEAHALTAAWLAGAHRRMPVFISRRIGFPLQRNQISRARFAAVTTFIATSEEIAQSLRNSGIPEKKIAIVHEGVVIPTPYTEQQRLEARSGFGVAKDQFLFGCVGVFVPEKGQRHLIEALPIVRASHPEARVLLAGDGLCRVDLESLARRLGQQDAVIFPGFLDQVEPVYAAIDAFAFPSEFEGLGTSLLVALATGLPVISTRRASLAEVVDPDRTGLAAEPNGPEFAAAMLKLIEDPGLRARLGEAARREAIARFSVESMVDGTLVQYQKALAERRKG